MTGRACQAKEGRAATKRGSGGLRSLPLRRHNLRSDEAPDQLTPPHHFVYHRATQHVSSKCNNVRSFRMCRKAFKVFTQGTPERETLATGSECRPRKDPQCLLLTPRLIAMRLPSLSHRREPKEGSQPRRQGQAVWLSLVALIHEAGPRLAAVAGRRQKEPDSAMRFLP
jgi:hypothetical protein